MGQSSKMTIGFSSLLILTPPDLVPNFPDKKDFFNYPPAQSNIFP